MIYYELRIKIDTSLVDADTVEKYREKVAMVQKQILEYKVKRRELELGTGNGIDGSGLFLDAGFDIFVPSDINIYAGSVSVPINHGIKCAMFIVNNYESESDSDSDSDIAINDSYIMPTAFYLYPRSSTGSKTSLRLSNSVGIIDSGYRGYIFAVFDHRGGYANYKPCDLTGTNTNSNTNTFSDKMNNDIHVQHVKKNDRLVQICGPNISYPIYPILVSDESELGFTLRGTKGMGSSGR